MRSCMLHMLNTDPTKHVTINSDQSFLKCLFQHNKFTSITSPCLMPFGFFANLHQFLICAHTFSV